MENAPTDSQTISGCLEAPLFFSVLLFACAASICAFTGTRVFAHLLDLEYLRIYWNSSICVFTGTRVFAHLLELEYLHIYWNSSICAFTGTVSAAVCSPWPCCIQLCALRL
uniref:Uncharacterized protein n=1 Tax=Cacopsylla melanoneura TaxID=428564 RepID=A0A8D8R6V4_9HEMI